MKTIAIIQASRRSNYFPTRYDVEIGGKSVLAFLLARLKHCSGLDGIALATTKERIDNSLAAEAALLGVEVFRGRYNDPLGRLRMAAKGMDADAVVRISGHCPLVDPVEIDALLEDFVKTNALYARNEHRHGVILGMGVEIVARGVLENIDSTMSEPRRWRLGACLFSDMIPKENTLLKNHPLRRPDYRVTLSVPRDVALINKIIENAKELSVEGVVEYLDASPLSVEYARQNIAASNEVGVEKLFLHPEKTAALTRVERGAPDISYPVSVELSLTDRCNLDCRWCSDAGLRKRSGMLDMDSETASRLLIDLARGGTSGVVVEGGGEPTLHPDFRDLVGKVGELGMKAGLISNGVDVSAYIDNPGIFDWIRISLDAVDPQQFLRDKGSDHFDTVMGNIAILADAKRQEGRVSTVIGVGVVLTKDCEEGLEDLVLTLRRLRVDYVQIRPVVDHPELAPSTPHLEYLEKYSTPEFTVNISNFKKSLVAGNHSLSCKAHSLSAVVAASGHVYLCGRLNKYDWFDPIGDLKTHSFEDIWKGERRATQSDMVLDPNFCAGNCPECRMTKYNVLLNNAAKIKTGGFV
jgi:spore coat polysaccharide biosynthesis protein SpsF (cytidylyltransferase family)/MoaA/NifB/PqqE/SkfB family radical SAM enzyme